MDPLGCHNPDCPYCPAKPDRNIDPVGMQWEGECEEGDGKLRLEFHPAKKPG